jgi:hypothetical protein
VLQGRDPRRDVGLGGHQFTALAAVLVMPLLLARAFLRLLLPAQGAHQHFTA